MNILNKVHKRNKEIQVMAQFFTNSEVSSYSKACRVKTWLLIMFCSLIIPLAHGQSNAIIVKTTVLPPITSKLYDYTKASKVSVQLINIRREVQEVYVSGMVSNGRDIKVYSEPGYKPNDPIVIPPGTSYKLNQGNYERAFDLDHMVFEGISKDQALQGNIPEGSYTFCFQAFDYKTNEPLSDAYPGGCSNEIEISDQPAPEILQPEHEANIPIEAPTVPIVWTRSTVASLDIQYNLMIFEFVEGTPNINEAVKTGRLPLVLDETTKNNSYMLTSPGRVLVPGKGYVIAVKVVDPTNKVNFRNDGWSEGRLIRWGEVEKEGVVEKKDTTIINIKLLSPTMDDSIFNPQPTFKWNTDRVAKDVTFTVKLFHLKKNQDPAAAVEKNKPVFVKTDIRVLSLNYPVDVKPLDSSNIYIWCVEGNKDGSVVCKSDKEIFPIIAGPPVPFCYLWIFGTPKKVCQDQLTNISIWYPNFGWTKEYRYKVSPTASWSNWTVFTGNNVQIVMPECGEQTVTLEVRTVKSPGVYWCWRARTFTVYVYPGAPQITQDGAPITEICWGDDAKIGIPNLCPIMGVMWSFRERPEGGSWGNSQSWPPSGTGTSIGENSINLNSIKPVDCSLPNVHYVDREYRSVLYNSNLPYPWLNCNWPPTILKIWCPTKEGQINALCQSNHTILSGNRICSFDNYPIILQLTISGQLGNIKYWTPSANPVNANPCIVKIWQPGPYTYSVTVQNGPDKCGDKTAKITFTVEGLYKPQIAVNPPEVCQNHYSSVSLTNPPIPNGSTLYWEFQNASGGWVGNPQFNLGINNLTQNTNQVGPDNPWYGLSTTSNKLCWRAKITTSPASICQGPFYSPTKCIDIIIPPGPTITIAVNTAQPKCCSDLATLSTTGPTYGTAPLTYQWFQLDKPPYPYLIPGETGMTYSTKDPGYYYVVCYNKNRCDSVVSNVKQIKCCHTAITISANTLCVDGVTPIWLMAEPVQCSINCCGPITSYSWTGPGIVSPINSQQLHLNGQAGNPPIPTVTSIYTVTYKDSHSPPCEYSATVTLLKCP